MTTDEPPITSRMLSHGHEPRPECPPPALVVCLSHGPAAQGSTSVLLTHTDGFVGHCPRQGPGVLTALASLPYQEHPQKSSVRGDPPGGGTSGNMCAVRCMWTQKWLKSGSPLVLKQEC